MKSKRFFSILPPLIAMVSALPVSAIEPISSCNALAAWAAGLEKLPADYASFTALPVSQRKAVYQRLSAAERAGLWQHQWQEALLHPGCADSRGWNLATVNASAASLRKERRN